MDSEEEEGEGELVSATRVESLGVKGKVLGAQTQRKH